MVYSKTCPLNIDFCHCNVISVVEFTPFYQHWCESIFGLWLVKNRNEISHHSWNDTLIESTFWSVHKLGFPRLRAIHKDLKNFLWISSQRTSYLSHLFSGFQSSQTVCPLSTLVGHVYCLVLLTLLHVWKLFQDFTSGKPPCLLVSSFDSPDFLCWGLFLLCLYSNTLGTTNKYFF